MIDEIGSQDGCVNVTRQYQPPHRLVPETERAPVYGVNRDRLVVCSLYPNARIYLLVNLWVSGDDT